MNVYISKLRTTFVDATLVVRNLLALYFILLLLNVGLGMRGMPITQENISILFGAPALLEMILLLLILPGEVLGAIRRRRMRVQTRPLHTREAGEVFCTKCRTYVRSATELTPTRMRSGRPAIKGTCGTCGSTGFHVSR
jgi:hypothetical protein